MKRNKQKGQSIVEFALILPILLLLLLGIIEGGRIIWSYITVQNAAREAARYAVAGRPLSCRGDPNDPEVDGILDGDPNEPGHFCDNSARGGDPWSNDVRDIVRVEAIERRALDQGRNLTGDLLQASRVGVAGYNAGKTVPGKFGVLVIGQDGDHPDGAPNIPGKPGWNVKVQTYYNVQMLDPIYDALLGGQVVHLQGEVELQNEGIDAANQGNYSGSISYNESNCPPDCGSVVATPYIIVQDAFGDMAEDAGSTFTVYAEDHLPDTSYELCFDGVLGASASFGPDCVSFYTNALGSAAVTYVIPVAAPWSETDTKTYRIYTRLPAAAEVAACATAGEACFEVTGVSARISASNIGVKEQQPPVRWPISSSIPIYIYGHDPNSSFPITFNDDLATVAPGSFHFQGFNATAIPTNNQGTNEDNDPAYYWATGHTDGPLTISSGIVSTTLDLTIAYLNIAGETPDRLHPQDDILSIAFSGLAPKQDYNVIFDDGVTEPVPLTADPQGDMFLYYVVRPGIIREDNGQPYEPGQPATPVDIELYDRNRGGNPNMIVGRTFQVFTPVDPYLNVPNGSQWPAGSAITIQGRQHEPGHYYDVRLEQGTTISDRVDNVPGGGIEAVAGSLGGVFDLNHIIPITYTPGFYNIRSYDCGPAPSPSNFSSCDYSNWVAEFPIRVTDQPIVYIEDGERWPPGATITIQLRYHAPNSPYQLWLDPRNIYGQRMRIKAVDGRETFVTDDTGYEEVTYYIPVTMTEQFDPVGYELFSFFGAENEAEEDNFANPVADNAHLEIVKSDLLVTRIELTDDPVVDTYIPIRVTVTNSSPVTITNHYFDTDLYVDPAAPPSLGSIVPPGEFKTWIDYIEGYGSVTFDEEIVLYGPQSHRLFARTDTSDRLVETDELNNMLEYPIPAACPYEVTDEFDDGVIGTGWITTTFGNSGQTCPIPDDFPPVLEAPHTALDLAWPPESGTFAFSEADDPFGTSGVVDSRTDSGTSTAGPYPAGYMWVRITGEQSGSRAVSTGAETTFTNQFDEVNISFDHLIRQSGVENDERIEYYLYIDGQPWNVGSGGDGLVESLVGGGDQYSNPSNDRENTWNNFDETINLTPGEHTFTWGILVRYIGSDSGRDAALNASNDIGYGYIDNISIIDTVDPQPNLSNAGLPASPLGQFHFSSDYDGFNTARDTFRDTTGSDNDTVRFNYEGSDGAWYDDANSSDGAVRMRLGRIGDRANHVSGAYQQSFTTASTCVAIQGYYRVIFPHAAYDGGEQTQVLLAVDGDEPVILDSYNGGDSTRPDDSGWVPFTVAVALDPATSPHLLEIGGYNNRSDSTDEITEIWFDDLYIIDGGAGQDTSNISESGGILTLDNAGANSLNIDDNAINPAPAGYTLLHRAVSSINGPFEVTVRLDNPPATADGEAGLELRTDTGGTSAKLMFTYANNGTLQIYSRASNAYPVLQRQTALGHSGSVWLRASRNGNQFTFDYSTVNSNAPPADWNEFEVVTFDLPDTVQVGLLNAPNIPAGQAPQPARFRHFNLCASDVISGATSGASQNFLGNRCGEVEEGGNGLVTIDAVNYTLNQDGYYNSSGTGTGRWDAVSDNDVLGEPTMAGLQAYLAGSDTPVPTSIDIGGVTYRPPHLQYQVNFETGGTYYVWVAGRGGSDRDRDTVYVGLNETYVGTVDGFLYYPTSGKSVTWQQMPGSVNISAGSTNTIHLWASHDDVRVYKILLTQDPDFIPPPDGMSQSACSVIVPSPIPPHLTQCINPIRRGDFEGTFAEVTSVWQTQSNGLVYGTTSQSGNRGATFPAFPPFQPAIYQDFELPTWMLEDTAANLKLDKAVDWRGIYPDDDTRNQTADDVLYMTLRRQEFNDADNDGRVDSNEITFNFDLIDPVALTNGAEGPDIDPNINPPGDWTTLNQNIFQDLNPLSFVEPGDRVRAYIYTRQPDGSPPEDTAFYLDNISLTFCTTQPRPEIRSGTGRLSGRALRFGQPVVGAEIWAYATADSDDYAPGPVFKTYSIQDGSYSFYNLPPGQYLIYATITDPNGTFFDSALRNVPPDDPVTNVILTIETS